MEKIFFLIREIDKVGIFLKNLNVNKYAEENKTE